MKWFKFALVLVAAPVAAAPAQPLPASFDILAPDAATTLPANAVVFAVSLGGCADASSSTVTLDGVAAPFQVLTNAGGDAPCALQVDLGAATGASGSLAINPSTVTAGWALAFAADDDTTAPAPADGEATSFSIQTGVATQLDVVGNAPGATDDVALALYVIERSVDDGAFGAVRFIPASEDQARVAWIDAAPGTAAKVCYRVRAFDAAGHDVLVDDGACEDVPGGGGGGDGDVGCAAVRAVHDGPAPVWALGVIAALALRRRRVYRAA